MQNLLQKLFFCIFLLKIGVLAAQPTARPHISDKMDPVPPLPDGIPELELVATWGDSRWMNFQSAIAGDMRYAAHDSILLAACGNYLTAWDAKEGTLLWEHKFETHPNQGNMTRSLRVSKTQPICMAVSDHNGAFLFNYYTGKVLKQYGKAEGFQFGEMSENAEWLGVMVLNSTWRVWNVKTGKELNLTNYNIRCLTFSPDAKTMAACARIGEDGQKQLYFIDLQTEAATAWPTALSDLQNCQSMQYSADKKLLALGFWGGTAMILDLETKKVLFDEKIDRNWVDALCFSPNSQQLLIQAAREMKVWDRKTNKASTWVHQMGNNNCWEDADWSQDGKYILLADRESSRPRCYAINDPTTDLYANGYFSKTPTILTFSPDSRYLAAAADQSGKVVFWNIPNLCKSMVLEPPKGAVGFKQIRFSNKGGYFVALPHPIYIDGATNNYSDLNALYNFPQLEMLDISMPSEDVFFTKDDKNLVGIGYGTEDIFNYSFLQKPIEKRNNTLFIDSLRAQFIANPELLKNQLWKSHSTNLEHWLNMKVKPLIAGGFSEWNTATDDRMCKHYFGGFSADGSCYAGLNNHNAVYIYDGKTGRPLAGKSLQGFQCNTVAISPDGNYVAIVGWDTLVRLYKRK